MSKTIPIELLEVPYNTRGTSPEEGFNCYSLVCYVRETYFNLPTPCLEVSSFDKDDVSRTLQDQEKEWELVSEPEPGDVVVMRSQGASFWHHCGVYLGDGHVIHAFGNNSNVGRIVFTPLTVLKRIFKDLGFARWRT